MTAPITGLYLVPADGSDLLDSDACGGRPPTWTILCGDVGQVRALALIHRGEVLPLGVARAGEYLRTDALSCVVEAMLTELSEGEPHRWRVVVVRDKP